MGRNYLNPFYSLVRDPRVRFKEREKGERGGPSPSQRGVIRRTSIPSHYTREDTGVVDRGTTQCGFRVPEGLVVSWSRVGSGHRWTDGDYEKVSTPTKSVVHNLGWS